MAEIYARDTQVGTFYESHYPNKEKPDTIYRFLRLEGYSVVWLEGHGQTIGRIGQIGDVGLRWTPTTFSAISKASKEWLLKSEHVKLLIKELCICDSLALFHAGCQCGHLKAIREKKKAS